MWEEDISLMTSEETVKGTTLLDTISIATFWILKTYRKEFSSHARSHKWDRNEKREPLWSSREALAMDGVEEQKRSHSM